MRAAALLAALLALPHGARADAISRAPPCEPGFSRHLGGPLAGPDDALWGHGGPPRCEPARCEDATACGPGQQCRLDAHCVQHRTDRELRPSPGRGDPLDPGDPASWQELTRLYDAGRCAEGGACPDGWRCVEVATCRPAGETDDAIVANERSAGVAERAWSVARPFGTTPAPSAPAAGSTEPRTEDEAAVTAESSLPPRTSAGCGCRASRNAPAFGWVVGLVALVGWRGRR